MKPEAIRNISIISHVDHGKTTLSDYLIASGGMLPKQLAGTSRALDFLPEEQKRGITIETSYVSYLVKYQEKDFQINLIDTPGHVDFSGKVAESLRLVDGAIVLVDAVEGIMAQTRTVIHQAVMEKIKLIVFVNKIDRLVTELLLTKDQIKSRIKSIILEIHSILVKFDKKEDQFPKFNTGMVILGSAIDGWAVNKEFVNNGGTLDDIINVYEKEKQFPKGTGIAEVINKTIISKLPSPRIAQQIKFPYLLKDETEIKYSKLLQSCDYTKEPIVIIGRIFQLPHRSRISYIVRILSGTLKKGSGLKSSITGEKNRIMRIFQVQGKSIKEKESLFAGQIGGIILSKPILPGDLLIHPKIDSFRFKNINYIQEPVIAISIEPLKINEIGRLQEKIGSIASSTPGMEFEINVDTGELLALGVGTLQLEILTNQLKNSDFKIEVSPPKVLKFEMPTKNQNFSIERWENLFIFSGKSNEILNDSIHLPVFSDIHGNHLVVNCQIHNEALDGLIEVYRQNVRSSPVTRKKIKNLTIIIESFPKNKSNKTYEIGMIIGANILRTAFIESKLTLHEPFYQIELNLPVKYLGPILEELKRMNSYIEDIKSLNEDSVIYAKTPVNNATKMADTIRQITDGHIFWSYSKTLFLPVRK